MNDDKPMYAVKRVHKESKIVEWLTVDDDRSHDWTDDREERELMANKPGLCDFDRAAGWRHFIVTVGGEPKMTSIMLARNEYALFDLHRNEAYVITPEPIGGSKMTFVGTSLSSVISYFRHKKP